MTSSNCYSSLYPFPIDLNEDDPLQHQTHKLFSFKNQFSSPSSSSSSSSSLTCRVSINPTVQDQEEEKIFVPRDGPLKNDCETKLSIWRNEGRVEVETRQSHENVSSAKWMPSKMRILRKMMSSDQPKSEDHQQPPSPSPSPNNNNNNNFLFYNNNNTIRVCSDCNTTKTPLWRSGPRGPKSLCNACGIRQRKARRAMAAEAVTAAANETVVAAETTTTTPSTKSSKVQYKAKRSSNNCVPRFKNKKCKLNSQTQTRNKLCFEELRIMLSKNSAFHQVFPQDEKEAAILLMALSYGLAVHG